MPIAVIISLAAGLGLIFGLLGAIMTSLPNLKIPHKKNHQEYVDLSESAAPTKMDDLTGVAKELEAWRKELTEKQNRELQFDAELLKREDLLKAEKEALTREEQKLTDLQKDIETSLIRVKASEEPKLQELADLYKSLKAEDAVQLLKKASTIDAIKVFTHLDLKTQSKFISVWLNTAASEDEKKALIDIIDGMKRVNPDDGTTPGGVN